MGLDTQGEHRSELARLARMASLPCWPTTNLRLEKDGNKPVRVIISENKRDEFISYKVKTCFS